MNKKYQIFLSSTYTDLVEERKEVIQALLNLDCIPVGMELFPATNDSQLVFIKSIINTCDYYVLLIGDRYGSTMGNGISYTQTEYEYAIEQGVPVVTLIRNRSKNYLIEYSDNPTKLTEFKQIVQKKLCKYWATKEELVSGLISSLNTLFRSNPRQGWVRLEKEISEDLFNVTEYISYFSPRRNEFGYIFENSINSSQPSDEIDIIGVSQRLTFSDFPGIEILKQKTILGVNFRLLLLDPNSIIVEQIENLSKDYGFDNLRTHLIQLFNGQIKLLFNSLNEVCSKLNGSFEVRLINNLHSTLSYYRTNSEVFIGLYFSHASGTHCPTFKIINAKLVEEAKNHFETLWEKSSNNILFKVSKTEMPINNFALYKKELFDYDYFENGIKKGISNYNGYIWLPTILTNKAEEILNEWNNDKIKTILDFGCAKGYLVKAFRILNKEAYGCDTSNYAISECDESVKGFCKLLGNSLVPDFLNNYDLITMINVLEHIPIDQLNSIVSSLLNRVNIGIYVEIPLGDGIKFNNIKHENDKTHIHRNKVEWWINLFERNSFKLIKKRIIRDDIACLLFNK